jgi:DNA-binding IclR family transcriptional regulator
MVYDPIHVYHNTVNSAVMVLRLDALRVMSEFESEGGAVRVMDRQVVDDGEGAAGPGVQVIARAASVLRALENRPEGLSLGQIAREVGLARSTVQRIVAALAAEDFVVEAQPGRGVRIGPGLARIAASLGSNAAELLRPHLIALSERVGETVDLSVLSGGSAVFVDQIPGRQRLVAVSAIGERFPLHCTANGKAILACFASEDAALLIQKSLAAHENHPFKDRNKLLKEIDAARRKHLAFDLGEHDAGIGAVGVATLDSLGRPIAVSIPAPTQRFTARREELSKALLAFREKMQAIVGR